MQPSAGDHITPTIELRKPLGAGGMGHVWIAWHAGLHTEVVVKLIAADLAQDPAMVARFSREAAAAAQVRSPHVVQIFDHGVTATGHPYIAMERLEGESLRERLDRTGVVPPRELAVIVGQCARALSRAHERGVVHRDIKPDNVFLTDLGADEPFVKVLDFGIAKTEAGPSSATTTGAVLGSPFYMSPEQILGKKDVDFHTDLWSLGVLTYEALLGVRPFAGETIGALSISICREDLPVPSSQRAGVPASFDDWFARACAREPRRRFASVGELADQLKAALAAAPATLGPVISPLAFAPTAQLGSTTAAAVSQAQAPTSSARRVVALVAVAVLGCVAGLVVYQLRSAPPPVEVSSPKVSAATGSTPPGPASSSTTTPAPPTASTEPTITTKPQPATEPKKKGAAVPSAAPSTSASASSSVSAPPSKPAATGVDHDPQIF
ncbi:MAG: protein kinase [Myxococcales bacterium]|nr:protein kinase [Myxococcales bacterium]